MEYIEAKTFPICEIIHLSERLHWDKSVLKGEETPSYIIKRRKIKLMRENFTNMNWPNQMMIEVDMLLR